MNSGTFIFFINYEYAVFVSACDRFRLLRLTLAPRAWKGRRGTTQCGNGCVHRSRFHYNKCDEAFSRKGNSLNSHRTTRLSLSCADDSRVQNLICYILVPLVTTNLPRSIHYTPMLVTLTVHKIWCCGLILA